MTHRNRLVSRGMVMAVLVFSLSSCVRTTPAPVGKTLYVRLGGQTMVSAVVDQFVTNLLADGRINRRFATADIAKLRGHFVDQVCVVTGGPCVYTGRDMKSAHAGLKISGGEFAALMEDLATALDRLRVPAQEKVQLLALFIPMKRDVVE